MNVQPVLHEAAKAAPPVTVTGLTIFGYPLPEVVMLMTLIYTTVQLLLLLWDRVRKEMEREDGCKR